MKKKYTTPSTAVTLLAHEDVCLIIKGSDGHLTDDGYQKDEGIDYGGESDGEDFAKHYEAWSTWDE